MFLSDSHHAQILPAEDYVSDKHYNVEMERLFLPGWHCVGCLADLPRDGDYLTMELFGRPLLIWRKDGEVHCYLNVCAHRFCTLTDKDRGHCQNLKCQYHGWEYDVAGDTQRIPDAKSFKPLKKGELGLKKFRSQTVGQLVFVTLNDKAPPLSEYLGRGYELCQHIFPNDAPLVLAAVRPNRSNWKVALENSLEGYHLETVHAGTFGACPDERVCFHELYDDSSAMRVEDEQQQSYLHRLGQFALRAAGIREQLNYHQFHRYPNFVVAKFGIFSWLETTVPTSPTDSYDIWRFFYIGSRKESWRAWPVQLACRLWGKRWFRRVIAEDEAIFPAIQQGLSCAAESTNGMPEQAIGPLGAGLISIREERIFHFQNYIKNLTAYDTDTEDASETKLQRDVSSRTPREHVHQQ